MNRLKTKIIKANNIKQSRSISTIMCVKLASSLTAKAAGLIASIPTIIVIITLPQDVNAPVVCAAEFLRAAGRVQSSLNKSCNIHRVHHVMHTFDI